MAEDKGDNKGQNGWDWVTVGYLLASVVVAPYLDAKLGRPLHWLEDGAYLVEMAAIFLALRFFDPVRKLLGPPVERPPMGGLAQAAILACVSLLLMGTAAAGGWWISRNAAGANYDGETDSLIVVGILGFCLFPAAIVLAIIEVNQRRQARGESSPRMQKIVDILRFKF
jgi:hypothetical protein